MRKFSFVLLVVAFVSLVAAGCAPPAPVEPASRTRLDLVPVGTSTAIGNTFDLKVVLTVDSDRTVSAVVAALQYPAEAFTVNSVTDNGDQFGVTPQALFDESAVSVDTGTFDPIGNGSYTVATINVTRRGTGEMRFTDTSEVSSTAVAEEDKTPNQLGPTTGFPSGGTIRVPVDSVRDLTGGATNGDEAPAAVVGEPGAVTAQARLAIGGFRNSDIADRAETYRNGQYAGQCRVFVNNVMAHFGFNISGASPNGYFSKIEQHRPQRITDATRLTRGDVVQYNGSERDPGLLHTFIIRARVSGNVYEVIDSNWSGTEKVSRHRMTVTLNNARRAYRFGALSRGDANYDLQVNMKDVSLALSYWGRTVPIGMLGDLNFDRRVGLQDLAIILAGYQTLR